MDGKTKAIVAHIFFIGWIIAFALNISEKDEITSFYIRQTLLLHLVIMFGWVPLFGNLLGLVALVFLIISVVSAINGEMKEIPWVGNLFQDWFKAL